MGKTVSAVIKLIDQFSAPSKAVEAQAKNIEKRFKNVGDTFKNVGAVFDGVGTGLSKTITAPLVAVGTAAAKFSADSQQAFQSFAASTGTAADEMGKYQKAINDVYKNDFGESIGNVADAMAKVKQNMQGLDVKSLSGVTKYAITLSDTLGIDVADSSRAAETMIKNFGISATQAFNLIAQGSQSGLDFSGEMIDSINEYSVQFKKMGMDAEDMFSIFVNGAKNGAFNLDKIGDAVKENAIRAIDGSDTTIEGYKAIGLNADEMAAKFAAGGESANEAFNQIIVGLSAMKDPVAQNTAGVNLFGTQWEDLSGSVIMSLNTTNESIDMTKNSMQEMVNTKYDTLQSALSGLWRTIQVDVLQPIGNMLIPYVSKGIDKVKQFTGMWNKLEPATKKNIVKFAGIAAAIGPMLIGFGKMSTGIGNAITSFGAMRGSVTEAGGIFKAFFTPANTVTLIIAAVAAAAILVYKNWDKIAPVLEKVKTALVNFGKAAAEKASQVWNAMKEMAANVAAAVSEFGTAVATKASSAWNALKGFGNSVKEVFAAAVGTGFDMVNAYFTSFYDSAVEIIGNVKGVLQGISDFISGVFTGNWETAWNGLRDIVGNAFGALEGLVKMPINAIISLVNKAIDGINSISFQTPDIPGIGSIGWSGLNIPHIPTLATGTDNWKGGIVQVHEKGGEIIDLPKGTRVYPHDESVRMARKEANSPQIVNIDKLADYFVVREEADIDKIVSAMAKKLTQTRLNMA